MIEKTKRKLLASFAVMIFLYMCIMFAQSRFMSMKSRETIGEIGELYMSEVNRQMQQKFEALELYSDSGKHEVIYGNPATSENPLGVQKLLQEEGKWISAGRDSEGNKVALFALEVAYPMGDEETSSMMVLSLPLEELERALVLADDRSLAYSMIIRAEGTFIAQGGDVTEGN